MRLGIISVIAGLSGLVGAAAGAFQARGPAAIPESFHVLVFGRQ